MKNILYTVMGIALLLNLGACSSADVTGDEHLRKYGDTTFKNTGGGTQTITVNITGSSETLIDKEQITDNDPANETTPKLDLALEDAKGVATKNLAGGIVGGASKLLTLPGTADETAPTNSAEKEPEKETGEDASAETDYETKFHHTTTGSSDGGKSLVLCPGQDIKFDSCSAGGVDIPFHGHDTGRIVYYNVSKEPEGDIVCKKGDRVYKYRADKTIVYGDC